VARRATLTRGCAEARLADLAQEPSPSARRGVLPLRWCGKLVGPRTQMRRGTLPAAPFHQIALIGGRTPPQFDLCSGNRDSCYRSSFYWNLKSMNY
jgi:hypothetical protein